MRVEISIEDGIDIQRAMRCVSLVIANGRVSKGGTKFCWVTEFTDGMVVATRDYTKADCFRVYKKEKI